MLAKFYIYICVCVCIYYIFLQKVLFPLHFGSCQNCISSANIVAEIHWKLCYEKALSTGEPYIYIYIYIKLYTCYMNFEKLLD